MTKIGITPYPYTPLGKVYMKKCLLITIGALIIGSILIYGALAFQKGENQIANGSFEADKVGEAPSGWVLETGG